MRLKRLYKETISCIIHIKLGKELFSMKSKSVTMGIIITTLKEIIDPHIFKKHVLSGKLVFNE